mgnify:CR=1 FL=1
MKLQSIFDQTDFVHASGTKEELQVANYLKEQCETLGVPAELESFRVAMGEIEEAHLYADGMGIPCKALTCCGSGSVEGELYYMPGTDPVSIAGAKDKIVLMDTQGIGFFTYQDLMKAGAKAILFQYGNSYYPHTDIDQRDLREAVVGEEKKVLCAMIHSAKAVERAGAEANIFVINNLSAAGIADSIDRFAKEVKQAQTIFIPGGFSGGDEPDGSGKFITAFFRNPEIKESVTAHLKEKDGLMIGICNGFQALIKLGLVPYGEIIDTDETCPTLSYNTISRHQSKIVRVRVATEKSPWLTNVKAGDIFSVPISHGEGRILAEDKLVQELATKGQILTQYVDENGLPTNDIQFNLCYRGSDFSRWSCFGQDGACRAYR